MAERTNLSLADDNPLLTKSAPELREILAAQFGVPSLTYCTLADQDL